MVQQEPDTTPASGDDLRVERSQAWDQIKVVLTYRGEWKFEQQQSALVWLVSLLSCGLICCFIMQGLDWGIWYNLGDTREIVVSPFPQVVNSHLPDSTYPCFYPLLSQPVPYETIPCEFEGRGTNYSCPVGYTCENLAISASLRYGCISRNDYDCSYICDVGIDSLDYLDETQTAKVLRIQSQVAFDMFVLGGMLLGMFSVFSISVLVVGCGPWQNEYGNRKQLAHFILASLLVVLLVGFFLCSVWLFMFSPAPFFLDAGLRGECYDQTLNGQLNKARSCSIAYFSFFCINLVTIVCLLFMCIYWIFQLYTTMTNTLASLHEEV